MTDRYENIRKALAMGPTPGPWGVRYDYVVQARAYEDGRLVPVAQPYGVNCDGTDIFANARLIAACDPDTIRELLALIDVQANVRSSSAHSEDVCIVRIIAEKIDEGRLDHPGFYKNARLSEALRNILALIDAHKGE